MKKILFLFIILMSVSISCSSSDDDTTVQPQPTKKAIPDELVGSWKISHYGYDQDLTSTLINNKGYYIILSNDDVIEYKDPNASYKGSVVANKHDKTVIDFKDIPRSIRVSESNIYPGKKIFTINYSGNNSSNIILIGAK